MPKVSKFGKMLTYLGLTRSQGKLKSLYHHYYHAFDHEILQGGGLLWGALNHKHTWTFVHMALQDHMANLNHYTSTTAMLMATKPDRIVTYLEWHQPLKLHGPSVTWSCKITWQNKKPLYLNYRNAHGYQNWCGRDLPWGVPIYKVT